MSDYIGISVLLAVLCALVFTSHYMDKPMPCYTFHAVQNSHMRTNTCTGEAHMVFKDGKGGFEWQRIIE